MKFNNPLCIHCAILTSAASSNFPKRSFRVSTNLSTERVVVSSVNLQMSANKMLIFSCLPTKSSLENKKIELISLV